jgi:hypothetical protein
MTKRLVALTFVSLVIIGVAVAASPPVPNYAGGVSRVEHVGLAIDTTAGKCVRLDMGTAVDAGWYLSQEPDAATGWPFDAPDAATWAPGADAAVWVPPDATVMGPRPRPRTDVSYVCTARNNSACLKQGTGTASFTCAYALVMPADSPFPPVTWLPEPDGGQPTIRGVSTSGASNLECCPVLGVTNTGR